MSTFQKQAPDAVRITRGLVTFMLFVLTIVASAFTIRSGNQMLMIGWIALPFMLILMHNPRAAFILALILDATDVAFPGLSNTSLGVVFKIVFLLAVFGGIIFGRRLWKASPLPEKKPMVYFLGLIAVLMAVRGSGLRALGSDTWGGMLYIALIVGIIFYFAANGLRLSGKQIRWIIFGSLLAGLIGSLFKMRGWAASTGGDVMAASRLTWLLSFSYVLFPLVFALKFPRHRYVSVLLFLLCLTLVGLTGFRSRLVGFLLIYVGYGFFRSKDKIKYAVIAVCLGLLFWGSIIIISPILPRGLQRAVSFVPGAHIDYKTAVDAQGSIDWRLEIWGYCLQQAPQYLLLGRGSAFSVKSTVANLGQGDIALFTPWFAFETRSYHSGPLSLLLDYGLPGLLLGLWLAGLVLRRFWQTAVRLAKIDTIESRYALFLSVFVLWQWVAFFLVFGSIVTLANMIATLAAAMVVSNSVLGRSADEDTGANLNGVPLKNYAGKK